MQITLEMQFQFVLDSENHRRNKALSLSLSITFPKSSIETKLQYSFIQCVLRSISEHRACRQEFVGCREPMFRFGLMDTSGGYLSVRFFKKMFGWLHHPSSKDSMVVNQSVGSETPTSLATYLIYAYLFLKRTAIKFPFKVQDPLRQQSFHFLS